MQLGYDVQIRDGLLAENTPLSEKPRLGFGRTETTVHQASIRLNYLNGNRVSSTVVFEGRPVSLMAQQQIGKDPTLPTEVDSVTVTAKTHWWSRGVAAVGIAFARFGRLGGPAHRGAIGRLSRFLENEGYSVTREKYIPTPNGSKGYRFADVYAENRSTGAVEMYQVGRTNANGTPVAREVRALDDIEGATGIRPTFVDYNAPIATGNYSPVPMVEPMPETIPMEIP